MEPVIRSSQDFYYNEAAGILPLRSELDFQKKDVLAPPRPKTAIKKKVGYVKGSIGHTRKDVNSYIYGLKRDVISAKLRTP